ncbi:SNF2-related protein [Clostridium perfringens]
MEFTKYNAKYFANELSRIKEYNNDDKITNALFNAKVDLNPHQVESALFAFKSPLSKGVILADEVGLGKTIEAGLVISQYWAENKRDIIVVCPSSLRHQWKNELKEKFNIESIIMESKTFNLEIKDGSINPFKQKDKIIITSYNFVSSKKEILKELKWDLVVIDEAHKLRNCYRATNKIGNNIKWVFSESKKLLLTATPLQNSLLELYGLVSLIDENFFGDINSFKSRYIKEHELEELRDRLTLCSKRNLRKDVLEYIKYTKRYPMTEEFNATDEEMDLYNEISEFLSREESYAIPKSQRALTTLIIRKLLASSTRAILQTLKTIKLRLEKIKKENITNDKLNNLYELVDEDFYIDLEEDIEDLDELEENLSGENKCHINIELLNEEINLISNFINKAESITVDAKSRALLKALEIGFNKTKELGGNRKVLIFTENKRTQEYLYQFLNKNGFSNKIVLFNGSNNSKEAKEVYFNWLEKNKNLSVGESKTANIRQALIDKFKDDSEIMIATEAAAEGVNMQFCSFVINYDLPWNPQRIEQRIGRCHRYGQKNDVVVINFVNKRNYADVRVYQLLRDKLNLFDGVFGSSDKVLGSIESGIDFEKKVLNIYQRCRLPEEIDLAFDELQKSMEESINVKMDKVQKDLFENFDLDVREKLKNNLDKTKKHLNKYENMFWNISKYSLKKLGEFNDDEYTVTLKAPLNNEIPKGTYKLSTKSNDRNLLELDKIYMSLNMNEPIGEFIINKALLCNTESAFLRFDISNSKDKISIISKLKGKKGYLTLRKLTVDSFEKEEHLLFNAFTEDGEVLSQEQCEKLFWCKAEYKECVLEKSELLNLSRDSKIHLQSKMNDISEANQRYFKEEQERLMKWEDDMLYSIDEELTKIKAQIRRKEREKLNSKSEKEMIEIDDEISILTKKRRKLRNEIEDMEDEIKEKRRLLTNELRKKMDAITSIEVLFNIKWEVV